MMLRFTIIGAVALTILGLFWTIVHNKRLSEVSVGMSQRDVLGQAGSPARVESPAAGRGKTYGIKWIYRWYGPVAIIAGHERWVYFEDGRVAKVYDAQSP